MLDYAKLLEKRWRKKRDKFKTVILELLTFYSGEQNRERISLDTSRQAPDKRFDLKREANRLVKRLARTGGFPSFSQRDLKVAEIHGKLPRGWIVAFRIPPSAGGRYEASNLFVTTSDVNELMYALYWRQVAVELNSAIYKGERIDLVLPKLPDVFTLDNFWQFVQSHEHNSLKKYLATKKKWHDEALKSVRVKKGRGKLTLRPAASPAVPEGMKKALVRVEALSNLERDEVKAEYLRLKKTLVFQAFDRGDFSGLSPQVQKRILETGHVPAEAKLTCHHIIPRSVGGKNVVENLVFLDPEVHEEIHRTYINPLMVYFDSLISEKRAVFFEIPVPAETKSLELYTETKRGDIVPLVEKKQVVFKKQSQPKGKPNLRRRFQKSL